MLRFLRSPVEIVGEGKVEGIVVERNELVRDDEGNLRARPTGETRDASSAAWSCARSATAASPIDDVPFDEGRAVIPNDGGHVLDGPSGEVVPGQYVTGWIKRGPSGVIGTNKKDANETVAMLVADLEAGTLPDAAGRARPRRSTSCSRTAASRRSPRPAGRRSTATSARRASPTAARG